MVKARHESKHDEARRAELACEMESYAKDLASKESVLQSQALALELQEW